MIFNSLNSVLAQSVVQTLEQPDIVNSTYKFNIETICGVLLLLVMGIGLGIWIGFKNVKGRKVRVYRTSSRHHHSSSKRRSSSSSESSEDNGSENEEEEDKEEISESTPKEVEADEEESEESEEKEDRESSSEGHSKSRKRRHRREHRPRGTSLAESGEGLPPPRPPGVPPPAFIKRDE